MTKCPTCGKVAEQSNKPTICRGCGDVMLLTTKIGSTVKQSVPKAEGGIIKKPIFDNSDPPGTVIPLSKNAMPATDVAGAIGQAFMGGGARIIRPVKKKIKREVENGD